MPFFALEFLLLDVLDFLQGHLAVLGHQKVTVFLALLGLLDATVGGTDLTFQAAGFLLKLFQGLQHMAQGVVLFVERGRGSRALRGNVLQGIRHAIPESGEVMLAAEQGLVGLVIPVQLLEPGALFLDAVQLGLLLFQLIVAVEELVNVEIKGIIGKLLVRLYDTGHRIGHGLVVCLHFKQQQDQRAQRLHPPLVGLTQRQHGIAHGICVH